MIMTENLAPPAGNSAVSVQLAWRATDNRFLFTFGDSGTERLISTNAFAPGTFYHVAGTYDGATFKLYVNGALEGQMALVKSIIYDATIPWTIGSTAAPYRSS